MKKVYMFLALAATVAVSASAFNTTGVKAAISKEDAAKQITRASGMMPKAVEANVTTLKAVTPREDGSLVWDFEDADAGISAFTLVDNDGDGYNWQYYNNTGLESNLMSAHEGMGLIASASYVNNVGALNPDNWLISPQVTLGGALKLWAAGQDSGGYDKEVFGVYVCTGDPSDLSNFVQIGTDKVTAHDYAEFEFDLSAYAGQTGYFAIVHHNVTDMFYLNIDDITLDATAAVTPEPIIPTDVTVEPTATTGTVAWVPGDNNGSWNLRWRPWVDPALASVLYDLPYPGYEDQIAEWMVYDADQDGYTWGLAYTSDAQNDLCFYSESWSSSTLGALTPDNWLITPIVNFGGTLKFDAWQRSASYPDKIMVYVCDNPNFQSLDEFVAVSEFIQPAGTTATSYEIDLSAYEGAGVIAFRHYDCVDQYAIYIDNIEVTVPNPVEIPEWTVVSALSEPAYTIEGLTPETEYEVQVMAYNEEGDKTTAWTASTLFTTLAEQVPEPKITLSIEFGTYEEAQTVYVTVENMPEGGVIKYELIPTNNRAWEDYDAATGIVVDESAALTVAVFDATGNKLAEVSGEFTITPATGIETITTSNVDNAWYNIAGVKFNGKPSVPGIYINNGKKVVIK